MTIFMRFKSLWLNFLMVLIIIAFDQGTKIFFDSYLFYEIPQPVFPGFNLTLLHNTGAAFSLWAHGNAWQSWFLLAVSASMCIAIPVWLFRQTHTRSALAIGLTLVLAGALSNLVDRVTLGYVVDFLDFYIGSWHWPAFNVADSSIVLGVIFALWGDDKICWLRPSRQR